MELAGLVFSWLLLFVAADDAIEGAVGRGFFLSAVLLPLLVVVGMEERFLEEELKVAGDSDGGGGALEHEGLIGGGGGGGGGRFRVGGIVVVVGKKKLASCSVVSAAAVLYSRSERALRRAAAPLAWIGEAQGVVASGIEKCVSNKTMRGNQQRSASYFTTFPKWPS
jgi:hypothetical protein